jgi:hypothetical protein
MAGAMKLQKRFLYEVCDRGLPPLGRSQKCGYGRNERRIQALECGETALLVFDHPALQ